jgi:nuclear mRNA export protein PCID2/THP1
MARLAWHDADLTLLDVESIVASLISQGYIKAYIMQSKGLIVFQKGDRMGLVAMNEVYPTDA